MNAEEIFSILYIFRKIKIIALIHMSLCSKQGYNTLLEQTNLFCVHIVCVHTHLHENLYLHRVAIRTTLDGATFSKQLKHDFQCDSLAMSHTLSCYSLFLIVFHAFKLLGKHLLQVSVLYMYELFLILHDKDCMLWEIMWCEKE